MKETMMDRRENGTIVGMRAVEGYYSINGKTVRQTNIYDVKSDEAAFARAQADGLVRGIMLEVFLTEPEQCTLGLNDVLGGGK